MKTAEDAEDAENHGSKDEGAGFCLLRAPFLFPFVVFVVSFQVPSVQAPDQWETWHATSLRGHYCETGRR